MKTKLTLLAILTFIYLNAQAQTFNWAAQAGDSSTFASFNTGRGISADAVGNVFVVGEFSNSVSFGQFQLNSTGGTDIFLAKYDQNGIVQWIRQFGTTSTIYNDLITNNSIATDAQGNTYVTGSFFSGEIDFGDTTLTSPGTYIVKYDANGNIVWVQKSQSHGSSILTLNPSGDIIVTGTHTYASAVGDTSFTNFEFHIAKFNSSGQFQWAISDGGMFSSASSICTDESGNILIAGGCPIFEGSIGGNTITVGSAFIAKYNNQGVFQWVKTSAGSGSEIATSISSDADDNAYVLGSMTADADFDTVSITAAKTFILKYDSNGNIQWGHGAGGPNSTGYEIVADASGNAYLAGTFQLVAYFGSDSLVGGGDGLGTAFIVKYSTSGAVDWLAKIFGPHNESAYAIANGAPDNLFVTGIFSITATFGDTTLTQSYSGIGASSDIFVTRLSHPVSNIDDDLTVLNKFALSQNYPNPFNPVTNINYSIQISAHVKLEMYNILGQRVASLVNERQQSGNYTVQFDAKNLSSGVYFYRLNVDGRNYAMRKMILMK